MEELIHAFGIDAKLIVIQILNFVVLLALLTYLLYKPVLKVLREREATIQKGVEDAALAAKAKENAEIDRKEVLAAAAEEASNITVRAKEHAKEEAAAIVKKAEDDATHTKQKALKAKDEYLEDARRESEAEIAKLAVLAAEKAVRES